MNIVNNVENNSDPSLDELEPIINYYKQGSHRLVISFSNQLLTIYPNSLVLLNFLAISFAELNELKSALASYRDIVKLDPADCNSHFNLGNIYKDSGDFDAAIKCYKKVLEINKLDADAFNNLGICWHQKSQFDKAIKSYEQAIILNPLFATAHNNMGASLEKKGNFELAIRMYRQAIKAQPLYAEAHNNLALALQRNDKIDSALNHFRKAIEINPNFMDSYINLGIALTEQNQNDAAIKIYNQAVKIDPNNLKIRTLIGHFFKNAGNLEAALKSYIYARDIAPDDNEVYFNIANLQSAQGDYIAAIGSFKKAITLKTDYIDAFHNMGVVYQGQGKLDKALQCYRQALKFSPDNQRSEIHFEQAGHLLAALTGNTTKSAPKSYIENLFDKYADTFDQSLVQKLEYCGPRVIFEMVRENSPTGSFGSILDLGCGTGLVGVEFRSFCNRIEGIDLSKSMINQAKKRNLYDKLTKVELKEYLLSADLNFDYFIATDVFIYVGDLLELFRIIKSKNKKPGRIAFTTEHTLKDGFQLEKSARYSHSSSYIENISKRLGYNSIDSSLFHLRKDREEFLIGGAYLLEF